MGDKPVCVVATGLLDDVNSVDVGNVVVAVVMPVPDFVSTAVNFTTNAKQLIGES